MNMQIHARLTKVDAEQRLIYGLATAESVDRSGEILDYTTSKPNFEKWVAESQEASDGQSYGNVRAMHGKVAAGKLVKLEFDDANKQIPVCAKIVDDNEWKKVLEGVYTGFSIGGSYAKKWEDPAMKKSDGKPVVRYTALPGEISLVDRPCLKSARFFDIQKADGVTERGEFKTVVADEDIEIKARELCKASGADPELTDTTDGKNEPLWKAYAAQAEDELVKAATPAGEAATPDELAPATTTPAATDDEGSGSVAKTDEVNEYLVAGSDADIAKLAEVMHKRSMDVPALLLIIDDHFAKTDKLSAMTKVLDSGELKKGMYLVGRLAGIVEQLNDIASSVIYEEKREGDTASVLPAKSKTLLGVALDLLNAMVVEESAEYLASIPADTTPDEQPVVMAMADFIGDMRKIGARNSKLDTTRIQKAHDLLVELGGACAAAKADADTATDSLQKMVTDAMAPLQKTLAEQAELIKKLSDQPAPAKGVLRALNKSDDSAPSSTEAQFTVQPVLTKDGGVDAPATLIKMVHHLGGVKMGLRPDGSPI